MLVYSPLSHVSYFTTRQSPPDLPELPPSTTTTALMFHLIFSFHFSPSPGTSFHFINPSYLKLNESPARFLLFFFIPACSFHNFPSPADHPRFSTPPSDSACPPLWMLPHTESGEGGSHSSEETLSVDGSRGWEPLSSPLGSESRLCSAPGLRRS